MSKYTPMIEQYLQIKENHQDAILFFRLGDFYEMFFDDARTASRELEIVLTGREGGSDTRIPMCGIPYHSASNYIARLINKGYKVAVCEQVEDPQATKGIVKREVIKVITPGTITDDAILEADSNNYLAAIIEDKDCIGFSYIDVSTGDFYVTEMNGRQARNLLESELQRLSPAECLLQDSDTLYPWQELPFNGETSISYISEPDLSLAKAGKIVLEQYRLQTLESLGIKDFNSGLKAAAGIILFLRETQKTSIEHLKKIKIYNPDKYLYMDASTQRNLELTATLREGRRQGSLLGILDKCCTSMGKRMLKNWLERPLRDTAGIIQRQEGIEELVNDLSLRERLKTILAEVYDLERLAGKIGTGSANPRDLLAIKSSCLALHKIKDTLKASHSAVLQKTAGLDTLDEIYALIDKAIDDEAPATIKEGDIIKSGYNPQIDDLRQVSRHGSTWLVEFENREKTRTGMKYLKVGFNKVFGYYLEVSKSNLHLVPPDYVRKQTLVNTERFICEELKNFEDKILGAREKLFSLEHEEFVHIRLDLVEHIERIQNTAEAVAELDALFSLAETAYMNDYIRPLIDKSGRIEIKSGRHPVVEKTLLDTRFVPNDIRMDSQARFMLITGPNMGGKSTFMRQVALIVIMAQMGSFVPAEWAVVGIADKIFTRVGASDDLAAGQSTFMVEMVEVSNILNNATDKSLVILDEIGRGTSTFDGLSIAEAVSEYLLEKIKARTLFATHYHELTSLSEYLEGVVNLSVSVKETGDTVVFLKKVLPGKADKSYGIHVAGLAGLPPRVIERAGEILNGLEKPPVQAQLDYLQQPSLFSHEDPILAEIKSLAIDDLSPREALSLLYRWKEQLLS